MEHKRLASYSWNGGLQTGRTRGCFVRAGGRHLHVATLPEFEERVWYSMTLSAARAGYDLDIKSVSFSQHSRHSLYRRSDIKSIANLMCSNPRYKKEKYHEHPT